MNAITIKSASPACQDRARKATTDPSSTGTSDDAHGSGPRRPETPEERHALGLLCLEVAAGVAKIAESRPPLEREALELVRQELLLAAKRMKRRPGRPVKARTA